MNENNARVASQRGYSLVEILVAIAIFVVVMGAALMMYDRSNKVFKQSVESSDMQQSTRVAFDKLVGDIRLAGYDFDRDGIPMSALAVTWAPNTTYTIGNLVQPAIPNGHTYVCTSGGISAGSPPTWPETTNAAVAEGGGSTVKWREAGSVQYQQPDEQIEYAGLRAITLRSNFDYETDTAHENGREQDPQLESSAFPVVTTGNDEIVTYALKSTNSAKNTDSIVFYADTDIPRDVNPGTKKKEATVTITGVDLSGNNPPYTLMRYTLGADGKPDAGTPIADNIRDMQFKYFKDTAAKTEITTLPLGTGQYDGAKPDEVLAERDTRAEIMAVKLSLVGMNAQRDRNYTDANETLAAVKNYRKYPLETVIVPRNLGRRGMREFNVDKPGEPIIQSICTGGCNAVYVTWQAPAAGGDIDSYSILYDNDDCNSGFRYSDDAGKNLDGYAGRFIEPGQTWYFRIQAINKFGEAKSQCVSAMVLNSTKPAAPTELKASGGDTVTLPAQANKIDVYFPPVTLNDPSANSASCNTGGSNAQVSMPGAEKRYYRIIRGVTSDFQPGDPNVETVLTELNANQPVLDGAYLKFTDSPPQNKTANCKDYFYRVRTVDYCARQGTMNVSNDASKGRSAWFPALSAEAIRGSATSTAKPEAPKLQLASSTCSGGHCDLKLTWTPVSKEQGVTDGPDIYIRHYVLKIYRNVSGVWTLSDTRDIYDDTDYKYDLTDLIQSEEYKLTLTADNCVMSDESDPLYYPCSFGTTVTVGAPTNYGGNGTQGSPWIIQPPASIGLTTSATVSKVQAVFYEGLSQVGEQTFGAGTSYTIGVPEISSGVDVLVRIIITDAAGKCTVFRDVYLRDEPPPPCALTDINSDPTVMVLPSNSNSVNVTLKNTASGETLTLKKIIINWDTLKGQTLASVTFPTSTGTTDVSTSCSLSNTVVTVPSAALKVTAGQTNYPITVNYALTGNKKLTANPINSICVVYQSSTGDTKICSIAPNAGTCTDDTGTCH